MGKIYYLISVSPPVEGDIFCFRLLTYIVLKREKAPKPPKTKAKTILRAGFFISGKTANAVPFNKKIEGVSRFYSIQIYCMLIPWKSKPFSSKVPAFNVRVLVVHQSVLVPFSARTLY